MSDSERRGLRRFLPERRELYKALWLGAVLLSITSSYTLVKVARDALFLSRLPARSLPVVYLLVGVVTLLLSWAFGRLTHRFTPLRTLTATAFCSALALAAFALAFESGAGWVPVAFYVWVNLYGVLLVSQFWAFTNSISDPREAKHIFGIIGGGGILGGLIGGWAAARFGATVPLSWLALGGAALLTLLVGTLMAAVRRGHVRPEEELPATDGDQVPLMRVAHVRWLTLVVLCSVIVTGLLDYQFKIVVQELHPDAPGLAQFFGHFFVAINVAALTLQLVGTRWLLQRLGAGPLAVVLPVGLATGAAATLGAPSFWTVVGTRFWDQVLRFSLNKSTTEIFYFPLEPGLRRRAKAFIEAGIERFGDALAGILILGVGFVFGTRPVILSAVVLALVVIWLVSWWRLSGGYVRELGRSLSRMRLNPKVETVSLRERGVLKQLVRTLASPYERVALHAFEVLEENAPRLLDARLPRLLEHPAARVRARALTRVTARRDGAARGRIERLLHDPDAKVRLLALQAHVALGAGSSLEALNEYLESPDVELRRTALACLVEYAGEPELPRVRARLESMLAGGTPEERAMAAEALGARPAPSAVHELLPALLEDGDMAVRSAAFRSAGRAQARDHIAALIRGLGERDTQAAAVEGLVAFGDGAAGTLGDWVADPRVAIEVRRMIPRVLRDVPTWNSTVALFRARDRSDPVLSFRVLKALNRIRTTRPDLPMPAEMVNEDLERDVRDLLVAEQHAASQGEAPGEPEQFLLRVLRERRQHAFNRVFRRLALLYPPAPMFAAYHGLLSAQEQVRGNAAEYIDTLITAEHRVLVAPLLPDAAEEDRRELARTRYGLEPLDGRQSLAALLEAEDPWLRTCALYVAGRRHDRTLVGRVEASLEAQDARVREAAGWAMLALGATG